jgi:hypothetical protein
LDKGESQFNPRDNKKKRKSDQARSAGGCCTRNFNLQQLHGPLLFRLAINNFAPQFEWNSLFHLIIVLIFICQMELPQ